MPHAAIIVTGALIFGVAAYTVYKEVIQPNLEQRRRDEEEEWNAQELNRVMQLSLLEHQHEAQRRADQERWEQAQFNSHSTSSSARYDNDSSMTVRRRRQLDPFSHAHEMQEVPSSSPSLSNALLLDAGPSSRLDTIAYEPPTALRRQPAAEDDELLETARSLSLTEEEIAFVKNEESLLHSPRSSADSTLDAYSVIEPDSRPASRFTSRSHSPLVVEATSSTTSEYHTPPNMTSQHSLTAASLEQAEEERQQHSTSARAASPAPTIRSYTGDTTHSHSSPSYVADSRAPSQASLSHSRPISPFSEIGFVSAHSSDDDNEVSRHGSVLHGAGSDRDSQWSDLGENSSGDESAFEANASRAEDVRARRQRYFAERAPEAR